MSLDLSTYGDSGRNTEAFGASHNSGFERRFGQILRFHLHRGTGNIKICKDLAILKKTQDGYLTCFLGVE